MNHQAYICKYLKLEANKIRLKTGDIDTHKNLPVLWKGFESTGMLRTGAGKSDFIALKAIVKRDRSLLPKLKQPNGQNLVHD